MDLSSSSNEPITRPKVNNRITFLLALGSVSEDVSLRTLLSNRSSHKLDKSGRRDLYVLLLCALEDCV